MADYDLKSITPDTSPVDANIVFGADDQSTATPKPYTFAGIKSWIQSWLTPADAGVAFGSPRNRFYTTCEFTNFGYPVVTSEWHVGVAGTGATITEVAAGSLNTVGVAAFGIGTASSARSYALSSASGWNGIKLGSGRARFGAKGAIHILSDATDTYACRMGFLDVLGTAEPVDGCFFRYTHGTNSGKWQAVTRSNNTETATDTDLTAVADAWKYFTIDVAADGSSVVFSVDGATVATNTTNIPTGSGRELGYGAYVVKTNAGTTNVMALYLDWLEVEILPSVAR